MHACDDPRARPNMDEGPVEFLSNTRTFQTTGKKLSGWYGAEGVYKDRGGRSLSPQHQLAANKVPSVTA